jgi:outer membrane protein TolC
MKNSVVSTVIAAGLLLVPSASFAQYKDKSAAEEAPKTEAQLILESAEAAEKPVVITLEQALEIALSENVSVKVADMEIERTGYAKKGAYAALFPQIDASGAYQRTIKKQVMYMDVDMSAIMGGGAAGGNGGIAELYGCCHRRRDASAAQGCSGQSPPAHLRYFPFHRFP